MSNLSWLASQREAAAAAQFAVQQATRDVLALWEVADAGGDESEERNKELEDVPGGEARALQAPRGDGRARRAEHGANGAGIARIVGQQAHHRHHADGRGNVARECGCVCSAGYREKVVPRATRRESNRPLLRAQTEQVDREAPKVAPPPRQNSHSDACDAAQNAISLDVEELHEPWDGSDDNHDRLGVAAPSRRPTPSAPRPSRQRRISRSRFRSQAMPVGLRLRGGAPEVGLGDFDDITDPGEDPFVAMMRQQMAREAASFESQTAHGSITVFDSQEREAASSESQTAHGSTAVFQSQEKEAASSESQTAHGSTSVFNSQEREAASSESQSAHGSTSVFDSQQREAASSVSKASARLFDRHEAETSAVAKRQKLEAAHQMELDDYLKEIERLQEELSFAQQQAAAMAARFLASGTLNTKMSERLSGLLAQAHASGNMERSDEIFLEHFLSHIARPNGQYNELIANVAEHYANLLGMQEYLTLASFLRLPKESWVKARRSIIRQLIHIGTMHGQMDLLSMSHGDELYVAASDATRITGQVEAIVESRFGRLWNYFAGICFPPNPLDYPSVAEMPSIPISATEVRSFVEKQHDAENIAINVNLTGFNCATDPTKPTTVVGAIPAARSGYTAMHQVIEWAFWRYWATHFSDHSVRLSLFIILLVGCATDSCGAELAAGLYCGVPNATEMADMYLLLGLECDDYIHFAKYFWELPWAWFGDWDHCLRTGRKGLHRPNTNFCMGPNSYATWGVIQQLKSILGPKGGFLHSVLVFNNFMEQSSDDSRKLFAKETIDALGETIDAGKLPDGKATWLFLKMVHLVCFPMLDPNYSVAEDGGVERGGPFVSTKAMWTGLYIMRLWRAYVRLSPGLTLVKNFISLEFYNTCEAMVHGCTNWYLICWRHKGDIPWRRAGPTRGVADTRPIEGIFSLIRAGKFNLTNSVNSTFKV